MVWPPLVVFAPDCLESLPCYFHDGKVQNWSKIVILLYANKRRESMIDLATGEFNGDILVETFNDADEGVTDL